MTVFLKHCDGIRLATGNFRSLITMEFHGESDGGFARKLPILDY